MQKEMCRNKAPAFSLGIGRLTSFHSCLHFQKGNIGGSKVSCCSNFMAAKNVVYNHAYLSGWLAEARSAFSIQGATDRRFGIARNCFRFQTEMVICAKLNFIIASIFGQLASRRTGVCSSDGQQGSGPSHLVSSADMRPVRSMPDLYACPRSWLLRLPAHLSILGPLISCFERPGVCCGADHGSIPGVPRPRSVAAGLRPRRAARRMMAGYALHGVEVAPLGKITSAQTALLSPVISRRSFPPPG